MKSLVLVFMLWLVSCKVKSDQERLEAFVNDLSNKATQRITVGNTTVTAKWLPAAYQALKNKRGAGEDSMDKLAFTSFLLRFDKKGSEPFDPAKLSYLDFDIGHDIVLLWQKDSLAPVICQRINNGRPESYEYLLAFEKSETELKGAGAGLVYEDQIFSIGTIAFVYNKDIFQKLPGIKTEKIDDTAN